jgi:hypothetical protein
MKGIFLLVILLSVFSVNAAENHGGKDEMNGISFKEYKEFSTKWQLVTIRFRKDTGEMRLTYANEIAMKTLQSGSINYPDGSVFAKTGIHTGVDDQFTSSVVPKGIRRYQLMVKNKSKYKATGGWGYGLYDPEGKTFPEDPVATQNACYACHTLVENRGDVFSQPFSFIENVKIQSYAIKTKHPIKFESMDRSKLPRNLKKVIPETAKRVRMLTHKKLQENVFQGTLDELKPILEQEARASQVPVAFISKEKNRFVVIIPGQSDSCMGEGYFKVISTDIELKTVEESYCTHD